MEGLPNIISRSNTIYYMVVTYGGGYVFANEYFLKRFNCHGLIDGSIQVKDTVLREDWAEVERVFKLCIDQPEKVFEILIRKPDVDGDIVHTSWEFKADESVKEIVCIGFDISQRVAYSKKVHEFGNRVNQIINSITDGFYTLDREWRFSLVNQVFLNTVGMTRKQVIGKCLWDIFPDDADYIYPQLFRKAMEERKAQRFEEYRHDQDKWYWNAAYPSDDGLIVYFKDITDRKIQGLELGESRNKLAAILNSTSESHILIAPNYEVLSFNKTASMQSKEIYGKQITEGMNILEYPSPGRLDWFLDNFQKALSGELVSIETPIYWQEGQSRWFRIEFSPAKDAYDNILGVVFNSIDIDELKRYEMSLEKSNHQLRAIAYQQSHEMRAPVAKVLGLIELLKQSPGDLEVMEQVEKASDELDGIVREIIAKTEAV